MGGGGKKFISEDIFLIFCYSSDTKYIPYWTFVDSAVQ